MTSIVGHAIDAGTPIAPPLVNTLNNLTSNHASLVAAMRDRLPLEVLFLLFAGAIISTVLVGRHHGEQHKIRLAGTICYVLLVSLAVCVILDLNQPFQGLMRISIHPLERLAANMAQ